MHKVLVAAALAACSASALGAEETTSPTQVFFLADPQIHNVYGAALKQMFPVSNWVSGVAIRPPEVNLLAPLVLRHSLTRGMEQLPADNRLVVVLGDGTNIGCSGEAEVFDAEFRRSDTTIRLMAHGNHDSYLMGTVNSYGPRPEDTRPLDHMSRAPLPVDETWYTATPSPVVTGTSMANRNWADGCYQPVRNGGQPGTPMNKVRWMARYAAGLEAQGLVQTPGGTAKHGGLRFTGSAVPGTPLAALNYRSEGIWYRPKQSTTPGHSDYARSWNSYMVQAVDLDARHTLVLIDTSVCQNARGGPSYVHSNAGQNACLGWEQYATLTRMLDGMADERSLIVGGHFPLNDLKGDRRKLIGLFNKVRPAGWTYVSGHTHHAITSRKYGNGVDVNIGSTTDWPMESHVLAFAADAPTVVDTKSLVIGTTIAQPRTYRAGTQMGGKYSELCRHLPVARALADASPETAGTLWVSPSLTTAQCDAIQADWAKHAQVLMDDQERISKRFDDEPRYRDFVLSVAASASLHEHRSFSLGNYLP
jgi:hypothetical protein